MSQTIFRNLGVVDHEPRKDWTPWEVFAPAVVAETLPDGTMLTHATAEYSVVGNTPAGSVNKREVRRTRNATPQEERAIVLAVTVEALAIASDDAPASQTYRRVVSSLESLNELEGYLQQTDEGADGKERRSNAFRAYWEGLAGIDREVWTYGGDPFDSGVRGRACLAQLDNVQRSVGEAIGALQGLERLIGEEVLRVEGYNAANIFRYELNKWGLSCRRILKLTDKDGRDPSEGAVTALEQEVARTREKLAGQGPARED